MRSDSDSFAVAAPPQFLGQAEELKTYLQTLDYDQCRALWRCNDAIAALNFERVRHMDLRRAQTPALFSYDGIQYRYMAPNVFSERELSYVQEHLRILSGFYGLLRPFDGVEPYRMEMQAKLAGFRCKMCIRDRFQAVYEEKKMSAAEMAARIPDASHIFSDKMCIRDSCTAVCELHRRAGRPYSAQHG